MNRKCFPGRVTAFRSFLVYGTLVAVLMLCAAAMAHAGAPDPEPELDELIDTLDPSTTGSTDPTGGGTTGTSSPDGSGGTKPGPGPLPGPVYPVPTQLLRAAPPAYWDNISALAGQDRLGAREISNIVLSQSQSISSEKAASDMTWQWGQFIDHDVDLTEPDAASGTADIPVPLGDPFFDPLGEGGKVIPFTRSIFDPATGTDPANPRQQINVISAFIDATSVYGQEPDRTDALRANDGSGRLKTSPGDFLPFNVEGFPNAQPPGADPADFFFCGDIRCNEQLALSAMHTLWVREHNSVADRVRAKYPYLSGDAIFSLARRIVISEIQVITFEEFLPLILGRNSIDRYAGYSVNVNPGIINVFSTAAYRLGHTMLSGTILRLNADGTPIFEGPLPLRDAFFTPQTLLNEGGLEPIMKGLASQVMQRIDSMIVDDVRNFLFGSPGAGGLDLGALNIQRGRDHGLPDYNTFRIYFGLTPKASFAEVSSDPVVQDRLEQAYGNINNVDAWVGALAEDHISREVLMGELLFTILKTQFENLRDGDPNWYQNLFSTASQRAVEKQTLAKVIARNTELNRKDLQANVLVAP